MKPLLVLLAVPLTGLPTGAAQSQFAETPFNVSSWPDTFQVHISSPPVVAFASGWGEPQDESDPAYKLYRQGYRLILGEKWDEARKTFAEVLSKYPKSHYTDDAMYWQAYALKHISRREALRAYEKFLQEKPHSSYYDDALADFTSMQVPAITPELQLDSLQNQIRFLSQSEIEKSVQASMRVLKRSLRSLRPMHIYPYSAFPLGSSEFEKLDPQIRLKIDAINALGEGKEDQKSFQTLRTIATSPQQQPGVRMVAMRTLSSYSKFDPLPVFTSIVRSDTSEQVCSSAIACAAEAARRRDRSAAPLIEMYDAVPARRLPEREMLLNAIADIGGDRAVNFLVTVARSSEDADLQASAIESIANAGNDKTRSVDALIGLYDALPAGRAEPRGTVLYSIAEVGNDRAVDFLIKVAKTSKNYELRGDAVYYLGNIGGDKARQALYEILESK